MTAEELISALAELHDRYCAKNTANDYAAIIQVKYLRAAKMLNEMSKPTPDHKTIEKCAASLIAPDVRMANIILEKNDD